MTIKGKAYIAAAFEHPTRLAPDKTVAQLHAEVALGALQDAGLTRDDVDGYFCSGDAPGPGPASMAEYMNLKLRHAESTELGGTPYITLASHAAEAIALGKCDVALITLAGRPRSEGMATGTAPRAREPNQPEAGWEAPYAIPTANGYAMRDAPHVRIRHHERAACLGQGRRLTPCPAQSERHAPGRRGRRRLKKHKEKLRKDYEWKRKRPRELPGTDRT